MDEKITIIRNGEGFGSIYQSIMSGIAYCEYYNKIFIYTPVTFIGHNVSNVDFEKITGLNELLNCNSREIKKYEYIREVHFSKTPDIYYTEKVRNKLRNLYYKNTKIKNCKYDIAVHIRRGDVVSQKQNHRYISMIDYKNIILDLKKKYPEYSICVYSEGNIKDFKELNDLNINYVLDGDPLYTFQNLVAAKILVTAKSSFSYSAALLSEGIIYYIPQKHKPLNNWNVLNVNSPASVSS